MSRRYERMIASYNKLWSRAGKNMFQIFTNVPTPETDLYPYLYFLKRMAYISGPWSKEEF